MSLFYQFNFNLEFDWFTHWDIWNSTMYSSGKQEFAFWNEGKSNSAGLIESMYELAQIWLADGLSS